MQACRLLYSQRAVHPSESLRDALRKESATLNGDQSHIQVYKFTVITKFRSEYQKSILKDSLDSYKRIA